ncbi:MAG: heterodisulfide reductase-related iron-sulfur binding cluster, partial [Thermodesulfovibrionales bacterium]
SSFGLAFAKSQLAAGQKLPLSGTVFMSVKDEDKGGLLESARLFSEMGFDIIATRGTSAFLASHSIENRQINKVREGRPHIEDLIKNGKLNLDKSRNDHLVVTYHDSCNTARGMGLLEEPRYVIKNVVNNFHEMPEDTIREKTFCCGSGTGLNASENMELRMRGGYPRANAVKYVRDAHGVNLCANICAIDRATITTSLEYWVPGVGVAGVHELVGNALVMKGEKERTIDMRLEPLPGKEEKTEDSNE